jgi:hypothetical protein
VSWLARRQRAALRRLVKKTQTAGAAILKTPLAPFSI